MVLSLLILVVVLDIDVILRFVALAMQALHAYIGKAAGGQYFNRKTGDANSWI